MSSICPPFLEATLSRVQIFMEPPKVAVEYLSESLRVEAHGKIKVTIVKPTGVLSTGLVQGVLNADASKGIVGHNGEVIVFSWDSFYLVKLIKILPIQIRANT